MKKISITLTLLSMIGLSYAKVSVDTRIDSTLYNFNVDKIRMIKKSIDGQTFSTLKLIGVNGFEGQDFIIGNPELPIISFNVLADDESDIHISEKFSEEDKSLMRVLNLKPHLASVPKIPKANYQFTKSLVYNSFNEFPTLHYSVVKNGQIRGQKQFLIKLFPLSFVGAREELKIARSYEVEVKNPVVKKIKGNAKTKTMLYIVGEKFKNSPSLTEYMNVKKNFNEKALRLEVSEGMSPDDIRDQVQKIYNANSDLSYALIIGDAADVKGHTSEHITGVTDNYYAAIDTTDYELDITTPDLYIGRISVANETQLATVLTKYTRYLKGTFSSNEWLGNLSFLATDDTKNSRYKEVEETHDYVVDTYTKSKGYYGNFPVAKQAGGDKLYAITYNADSEQVMNSLFEGRAIINYSGHGSNTTWVGPEITQSDVRSLKNTSLPFVISNACITGDYRVKESFAETWQRQEWGASMYWGSMDLTYWEEDNILERSMYDGIFKLNKLEFGEITHYANSEVTRYYSGKGFSKYYWETYHMFGDPSLQLRLK
jgi:hypothetical protein